VMDICLDEVRTEYFDMKTETSYKFECRGETWGLESKEPEPKCKAPEADLGKEGEKCSSQSCGKGLCCGKATSNEDDSDVMDICLDEVRTEYFDMKTETSYKFDCLKLQRSKTWGLDCEDASGGCSGFIGFFQNLFGQCKSSKSESTSDDVRLFATLGRPLFQDGPSPALVLCIAGAAGLVLMAVIIHRKRTRYNSYNGSAATELHPQSPE